MVIRIATSISCCRGPTAVTTSKLWPENSAYSSGAASRSAFMQPMNHRSGALGLLKMAPTEISASPRALRPPSQLWIPPVDPFQHIGHLRRRDRHRAVRHRGPDELAAIQALGIERH